MSPRALAAPLLVAAGLALAAPPSPAGAQGRDAPGITEQEAKIGREQHQQVLAQFGGPYEDPELQAYVDKVGERLLAVTEFKGEDFTFTLLNSDVVNAFALPGGYVYVSRGLLALARDEAELAGVVGHEIGHVVARHPIERAGRATTGQALGGVASWLGAAVGGYFGGELGAQLGAQLGGVGGSLGAQAWVQGFSREQEFEADQLGIRYLQEAGYEPRAMASFLGQLRANDQLETRQTGAREASQGWLSNWLRSHPRTEERVARATEISAAENPGSREQDREAFLAAIDGMVYGDDPSQGFVRGRVFEHPELGFRFTAPEGFTLKNTPSAVIGRDRQGRFMNFDMAKGRSGDPETFIAREWGKDSRVQNVQPLRLRGGLEGAAGFAQIQVNKRPAEAMLVAIEAEGGLFYRFMFADPRGLDRGDVGDFEAVAGSLERLAKGDAGAVRPLRVDIHTVRSGETQEDVARLMQVEQLPLETFRVLNGLEEGQELRAGDGVKIIVRG